MRIKMKILSVLCLVIGMLTDRTTAQSGASIYASANLYTVEVRLQSASGGKVPAGTRAYVSVPGLRPQFRSATCDEEGTCRFLLNDLTASAQMIFQTGQGIDSSYRFVAGDPFVQRHSSVTNNLSPSVQDTLPFYGFGDRSYLLDDYTRFPTLEEVFQEFVPDVKLKRSRTGAEFSVFNLPFMIYQDQPPLVLLDGVPVFDLNRLLELDPLKLKKLEVVARKYFYGSLICNGIVALYSYDGGLAGYQLPKNALVTAFSAPPAPK